MAVELRVGVVGAGIGGLTCAIDLAVHGYKVTVLEREPAAGGKARPSMLDGRAIDAGPTVLTMPWVFDELFAEAGASFRNEVELERAEMLARHAWSDGTRLDLHADRSRSADAIGDAFGAAEARAYLAFCEDGRRIYEISEKAFLRSQRPTIATIVKDFGVNGLAAFAQIDGHRTMWRSLERRFASRKLRQLFGRYATYSGASPYEAPATLNLIAHVEAEGVFRARGGAHGLVAALERLARGVGVDFLYDHPVDRIDVENGRTVGVTTKAARHPFSAVVFNGDVSALGSGLLGAEAARAGPTTLPRDRSLSAVTWVMLARATGFPLVNHNVFFSDDYAAEFRALLGEERFPEAPTLYVCAEDRKDVASDAEEERFLIIANAPATGDSPARWTDAERDRCTTVVMKTLRRMGLMLEPRLSAQRTPADYHRIFPGTGGAIYGPRSTGALSALGRQSAETKIARLYLAGGSVHPGAGVPMAALSGRLAAARIRKDLPSTGRSVSVATSGTTSTA